MSAGFYALNIAEVRCEIADAISVRFTVPETLQKQFQFTAGQHVTLRQIIDGEDVRRNYSVCVSPLENELRVAIKQVPGGVFSSWANTHLSAGQSIEVMPPHGSFTWAFDAAATNHYCGFAGGSGITPILSLLKTALQSEPQSRFTLLYGNRTSNTVMFLDELADLKNRFMGRLEVFHFLDEEEEDIELFNGRMDHDKCISILETLIDPANVSAFFICGPGPMMDAAEAALMAKAVPAQRIFIERFTIGRPSAAVLAVSKDLEQKADGFKIIITLEGRRRAVAFSADAGNILDSARAAGMSVPYACKAGVCATCRAKVLHGDVEMKVNYGLSDDEVAQGYVLTCQAVPKSADVIIDYDG